MTLQRKITRSVGKNLSFYLTGSVLTAITIMLLVGAFAVSNSLYFCFDDYFAKTNIEDGYFTTQEPISEEEKEELEAGYDLTLEKQQYVDLEYHDTKLRLHTQTQNVDLYTISEGRDIESGDELVLTYNYAKANSIAVGDKLKLAGREFTVCGLGMKSDYAIMLYALSETIPNKSGFGIGIITQETMAELGTPMEFYSVRYRDPEQERAFREELYQKKSRIFNGSNAKLPVIYSIRSLTINGFRSLTFVIGIAIATLCIVLGGSFEDAYDHLLKVKVPDAMLGGQYEYGFQSFQTENPYGGAAVFDISFGAKKDNSRFNMIGYEPDNGILNTQTVEGAELEYGKYYMTSAAANKYGVAKGDSFCFYNTVTMQETTVTISGVVKNDILPLVLTSKENVAQLLNRPLEEYNVIISKEKLTIPNGLLKKNASIQDYEVQVRSLSTTAGIVLKLLKVLGMLICLLIVTMMSGFIIGESSRNISMLEVLGYRKGEVRRFVLTVNHFLVPVGFILGVPLGYLVAYSMILSAAQSSGRLMSLPVRPVTLLGSFVFVLAAYGIAMALAGRKLKKVDMVESLKCPNE